MGISAVFTPKNFQIFDIMSEIVEIIDKKTRKKISEIAVESLRLLNKYKLEEFVPIIIEKKKIGWIYKENLNHLISNSLLDEERNRLQSN